VFLSKVAIRSTQYVPLPALRVPLGLRDARTHRRATCYADAYAHPDIDCYAHANGYANRDTHADRDQYPNGYAHANGYAHTDRDAYQHAYADPVANANADPAAAAYVDADAGIQGAYSHTRRRCPRPVGAGYASQV
jgi:hypothetical protein